jgi:hypothetical protein
LYAEPSFADSGQALLKSSERAERQSKSEDCDSDAPRVRLVTEDAPKLDAQWARQLNF